nr:hypothetical protein CFP56_30041 [Quercus suber]
MSCFKSLGQISTRFSHILEDPRYYNLDPVLCCNDSPTLTLPCRTAEHDSMGVHSTAVWVTKKDVQSVLYREYFERHLVCCVVRVSSTRPNVVYCIWPLDASLSTGFDEGAEARMSFQLRTSTTECHAQGIMGVLLGPPDVDELNRKVSMHDS